MDPAIGEPLGEFPAASPEDIRRAVARAAPPAWAALPPVGQGPLQVLERLRPVEREDLKRDPGVARRAGRRKPSGPHLPGRLAAAFEDALQNLLLAQTSQPPGRLRAVRGDDAHHADGVFGFEPTLGEEERIRLSLGVANVGGSIALLAGPLGDGLDGDPGHAAGSGRGGPGRAGGRQFLAHFLGRGGRVGRQDHDPGVVEAHGLDDGAGLDPRGARVDPPVAGLGVADELLNLGVGLFVLDSADGDPAFDTDVLAWIGAELPRWVTEERFPTPSGALPRGERCPRRPGPPTSAPSGADRPRPGPAAAPRSAARPGGPDRDRRRACR